MACLPTLEVDTKERQQGKSRNVSNHYSPSEDLSTTSNS